MADKTNSSGNRATPASQLEDLPALSPEISKQEAERIKGAAYKPTHALGNYAANDLGPDNIQK